MAINKKRKLRTLASLLGVLSGVPGMVQLTQHVASAAYLDKAGIVNGDLGNAAVAINGENSEKLLSLLAGCEWKVLNKESGQELGEGDDRNKFADILKSDHYKEVLAWAKASVGKDLLAAKKHPLFATFGSNKKKVKNAIAELKARNGDAAASRLMKADTVTPYDEEDNLPDCDWYYRGNGIWAQVPEGGASSLEFMMACRAIQNNLSVAQATAEPDTVVKIFGSDDEKKAYLPKAYEPGGNLSAGNATRTGCMINPNQAEGVMATTILANKINGKTTKGTSNKVVLIRKRTEGGWDAISLLKSVRANAGAVAKEIVLALTKKEVQNLTLADIDAVVDVGEKARLAQALNWLEMDGLLSKCGVIAAPGAPGTIEGELKKLALEIVPGEFARTYGGYAKTALTANTNKKQIMEAWLKAAVDVVSGKAEILKMDDVANRAKASLKALGAQKLEAYFTAADVADFNKKTEDELAKYKNQNSAEYKGIKTLGVNEEKGAAKIAIMDIVKMDNGNVVGLEQAAPEGSYKEELKAVLAGAKKDADAAVADFKRDQYDGKSKDELVYDAELNLKNTSYDGKTKDQLINDATTAEAAKHLLNKGGEIGLAAGTAALGTILGGGLMKIFAGGNKTPNSVQQAMTGTKAKGPATNAKDVKKPVTPANKKA